MAYDGQLVAKQFDVRNTNYVADKTIGNGGCTRFVLEGWVRDSGHVAHGKRLSFVRLDAEYQWEAGIDAAARAGGWHARLIAIDYLNRLIWGYIYIGIGLIVWYSVNWLRYKTGGEGFMWHHLRHMCRGISFYQDCNTCDSNVTWESVEVDRPTNKALHTIHMKSLNTISLVCY